MQFYSVERLWLLWVIPILVILLLIGFVRKKKLIDLFAYSAVFNRISYNISSIKQKQKIIYCICAVVCLIIALAQPQWGNEKKKIRRKGVDIIFLLDTSESMLAQDIQPSRFEKAKMEIYSLLKKLSGDRVALVAFAGSSFLDCPLTLDYAAFKIFLDSLTVGFIPEPGTALADALKTGIASFSDTERKYQVIIIFSDGEDHEGGISDSIKRIKMLGIRVYSVGMGTPIGGTIPIMNDQRKVVGHKKDPTNQIIITKLQDSDLRSVAEISGGLYYQVSMSDQQIDLISKHIKSLEKREFKDRLISEKEDHFQIFLLISFILLFLEILTNDRKTSKRLL